MTSHTEADYMDQIFPESSGLADRELFTGLFNGGEEDQWMYTQKREAVSCHAENGIYVTMSIFGQNT